MIYQCQKCLFIHEGDMPDGYFCPLCREGIFCFKLIKKEKKIYNRIQLAKDNPGIDRIDAKCVNCGICRKTCENIVGINLEEKPICLACGQCILTCPTGALTPKYAYQKVMELIKDKNKIVVILTSPAVRVGIGDGFGYPPGEFLEGKMIASLKALGADYVYDVSFGADLKVFEETAEIKKRIKNNGKLPIFTSCCPAWIKYAENYYPKLKANISSCKSPNLMVASLIRHYFAKEEGIKNENLVIVSLTPCPAKKSEFINTDIDYVITTSELAYLLKEQNIDFKNLKDEEYDALIGSSLGVNAGVSGGIMLGTLSNYYYLETKEHLTEEYLLIKDQGFYTEYSFEINNRIIKAAAVSTMPNLEKLLPIMNNFVFIEVMNCYEGCINGGGQILMEPKKMSEIIAKRKKHLKRKTTFKYAYENSEINDLYEDFLEEPMSNKSKKILHK